MSLLRGQVFLDGYEPTLDNNQLATVSLDVNGAVRVSDSTSGSSLSSIDGYVESMDGYIQAIDTTLSSVETYVASADGYLNSINSSLTDNKVGSYQAAVLRTAEVGLTPAANVSSVTVDANHQALDATLSTLISGEDQTSNTLTIQSKSARNIFDGYQFVFSNVSPLLSSTSYYWTITTPNTTTRCQFSLELSSNATAFYYLYENPTISGAGTSGTAYNANRNSATAATATVAYGASVSSNGNLLWSRLTGASGIAPGNTFKLDKHFILKQNEDYLIKATTVGDGYVSINMSWDEVSY